MHARRLTRFEKILILTIAGLAVTLTTVLIVLHPGSPTPESDGAREEPASEDTSPTPEPTVDLDVSGVSLSGRKIIVDAGHGGSDKGCTGVDGRLEKEVNLEIAQKVQARLEKEGVEVVMTRETDDAIAPTKEEDMALREQIILTENADAFLSIHQNEYADDSSMSGPQVFYAFQGTQGKKLAVAIQTMLNSNLDLASPRMALNVPYDLLIPGTQPSCTVECGFFSNPEEEALLQTEDYQNKLAGLIVDGIKLYFRDNG